MSTESERTKILEMIESGVISAEDGIRLLDALDGASEESDLPELEANLEVVEPLSDFDEELPDDFGEAPEEILEPDAVYQPEPVPSAPDPQEIKKWKRWWLVPMLIGVGITVLGGAFMYGAYANSGISIWFACTWFPFMLGVLVMALAWASRTAPWLHVRVQQKPGETPQRIAISFPLPLGMVGWAVRIFGHRIPNIEGVDLQNIIKAIDESAKDGTPFFVDVDDEDGERVQVFIG